MRLAPFQDMPQYLLKLRAQELKEVEPDGVWDDLEADFQE